MCWWECIIDEIMLSAFPLQATYLKKNHPQKHKFASPEKYDF